MSDERIAKPRERTSDAARVLIHCERIARAHPVQERAANEHQRERQNRRKPSQSVAGYARSERSPEHRETEDPERQGDRVPSIDPREQPRGPQNERGQIEEMKVQPYGADTGRQRIAWKPANEYGGKRRPELPW
jgi:hypothetical protein